MAAKSRRIGRRDLLKAAGVVFAMKGPMAIAAPGGGAASREGEVFPRAWSVKSVAKPTLGETNSEFQRFSGANIFEIYRPLKNARDGSGAFEAEQAAKTKSTAECLRKGLPGLSLRDRQLSAGAGTVNRNAKAGEGLLSWTRVAVKTPAELGVPPYSASPEEAALTVKAAARFYGAGMTGIAPMNETYINRKQTAREGKEGLEISIEDVDIPSVTPEKFVIPRRMKWVVAIAIPMDLDLLSRAPTALGDAAVSLGYSDSAFVVASLAEFIRGLGYQAIPSVNDTALSIPFAVHAGLGELSRLNKLVSPEFGAGLRLCKVFTDLPMACDKPIDCGIVEFCKRCKKCAEACPSRALSFDEEPSFKVRGPWNNPGHKAWFEDSYKCYQYWQKVGSGCAICVASCPFTKAAGGWVHDMVETTVSITPVADHFFRAMDDAFGYGKQPRDLEQWWTKPRPVSSRNE
jgi:epoxyqueuosine reductase